MSANLGHYQWTPELKKRALDLWVLGMSGSEVAKSMPGGYLTRQSIIGMVWREGKAAEKATGVNPYNRPERTRATDAVRTSTGPRKVNPAAKPARISRQLDIAAVTPGTMLPPQVKLDSRLWISLPDTPPKTLMECTVHSCRWPVDNEGEPLFCGAGKEDDSSYCKTHRRWSVSRKPLAPLNFNKRAA